MSPRIITGSGASALAISAPSGQIFPGATSRSPAISAPTNSFAYAAAMLAVDPSIKLIAVGDNNMDWNRTVLREAGAHIDFLAVHHYYGTREMRDDPLNLMAHPLFYDSFYKQLGALIRELVPGREIKLNINERS